MMNSHTISPPKLMPFIPKPVDMSRRSTVILTAASPLILTTSLCIIPPTAGAFEFRLTTPDMTVEDAEAGIQPHAKSLVGVRELLASESWKEAQKVLRKSAASLKLDIYRIIQSKPTAERRRLRELYSDVFNSASRMDYAAMDEDKVRVWECYNAMVSSLEQILPLL